MMARPLDDGQLDVVCSRESSRLHVPRQLPRVFKGAHLDDPRVEVRRARELRVAADRPFALSPEGDPIARLPATIRALPGAVQVLMPSDADPAGIGPRS